LLPSGLKVRIKSKGEYLAFLANGAVQQYFVYELKLAMSNRVFADINPKMLAWARETRGYDLEVSARKIGISTELLSACEAGAKKLSIPQLKKAATAYKRPLAIFYLDIVPPTPEPVPDLRRLPETLGNPLSPELKLQLRRIAQKRKTAAELMEFGPEFN
jgi:hypothetical protein